MSRTSGKDRRAHQPRAGMPLLVPPWVAVAGVTALIAATIGATVFESDAGGTEAALNAISFLSFVCIFAGVATLVLATSVAWLLQEGPTGEQA
jgi:hypothetical protein